MLRRVGRCGESLAPALALAAAGSAAPGSASPWLAGGLRRDHKRAWWVREVGRAHGRKRRAPGGAAGGAGGLRCSRAQAPPACTAAAHPAYHAQRRGRRACRGMAAAGDPSPTAGGSRVCCRRHEIEDGRHLSAGWVLQQRHFEVLGIRGGAKAAPLEGQGARHRQQLPHLQVPAGYQLLAALCRDGGVGVGARRWAGGGGGGRRGGGAGRGGRGRRPPPLLLGWPGRDSTACNAKGLRTLMESTSGGCWRQGVAWKGGWLYPRAPLPAANASPCPALPADSSSQRTWRADQQDLRRQQPRRDVVTLVIHAVERQGIVLQHAAILQCHLLTRGAAAAAHLAPTKCRLAPCATSATGAAVCCECLEAHDSFNVRGTCSAQRQGGRRGGAAGRAISRSDRSPCNADPRALACLTGVKSGPWAPKPLLVLAVLPPGLLFLRAALRLAPVTTARRGTACRRSSAALCGHDHCKVRIDQCPTAVKGTGEALSGVRTTTARSVSTAATRKQSVRR